MKMLHKYFIKVELIVVILTIETPPRKLLFFGDFRPQKHQNTPLFGVVWYEISQNLTSFSTLLFLDIEVCCIGSIVRY